MIGFKEIKAKDMENAVKLIGGDWMLITASDGVHINTMNRVDATREILKNIGH